MTSSPRESIVSCILRISLISATPRTIQFRSLSLFSFSMRLFLILISDIPRISLSLAGLKAVSYLPSPIRCAKFALFLRESTNSSTLVLICPNSSPLFCADASGSTPWATIPNVVRIPYRGRVIERANIIASSVASARMQIPAYANVDISWPVSPVASARSIFAINARLPLSILLETSNTLVPR